MNKKVSLANAYRPKNFHELIGQDVAVTILTNNITQEQISHAYLLTGTRGVGKTTIARIIAKTINCINTQNAIACCKCDSCTQIDMGNFVDVIELDAASNTGVDNMRDIIDNARYVPSAGKYKVYIIDEAHMLSKSAFNAMLKILEEPPKHVVFILATTEYDKIPITIVSRCLHLPLKTISEAQITHQLKHVMNCEDNQFEDGALEIIAKAAQGSMRDALSILSQAVAFSFPILRCDNTKQLLGMVDETHIYEIFQALSSSNANLLNNTINTIYNSGCDIEKLFHKLMQNLCDINLLKFNIINNDIDKNLIPFAKEFSHQDIQLYFEILNIGLNNLKTSNATYQIFAMTMFRMLAFNINLASSHAIIASNTQPPSSKLTAFSDLVLSIKSSIPEYLYPFLENASLRSHIDDKLQLTIDERYRATFNPKYIGEIQKILSQHLQSQIQVSIDFNNNLEHTLKQQQINTENKQKQQAIDSINSDEYLKHLTHELCGTIMQDSIVKAP